MAEKKIIAVLGATGAQGSGLVGRSRPTRNLNSRPGPSPEIRAAIRRRRSPPLGRR